MGITKSELTQSIVMVFIVSNYARDLIFIISIKQTVICKVKVKDIGFCIAYLLLYINLIRK